MVFKKKFLFFIVLLFESSDLLYSQATNGLSFPQANNRFLGIPEGKSDAGDLVSVDLFTGTAQINIPLFTVDSRSLKVPVSVSYSGARGIKVQDYASSLGLGWQLKAGGAITRVVRGYPDEHTNGYLGTGSTPSGALGSGGQWGKVVANQISGASSWTTSQFNAITGISSGGAMGTPTADGEPDMYYVRTPFFSFQFTFDENGNAVVSNGNGIKIISSGFLNNPFYGSSNFEVIDDRGNEYYFGSTSSSTELSTAIIFGSSLPYLSTWYLDKIISYNAKDVITLTYTSLVSSDVLSHYQNSTTFDLTGHSNFDNTTSTITISQPKVLSTIVSPLGSALFTYVTGRRDDVNGTQLSSITLNAYNPQTGVNNTALQTYSFNYSYFGDPSSDPNVLRLKLDYITVAGNTTATSTPLPLHTFVYNTAVNLPSRTALGSIDYWGYNTYITGPNTYNQPQQPNLTYATAGMLITINSLAGDGYQIGYELNDYNNTTTGSDVQIGGLRVNQITHSLAGGDNLVTQYKYNKTGSSNSSGQILSNTYLVTSWSPGNGITKTLSETPSNFYDLNGNFVGYSNVKVINPNGGYTISTFSNFLDPNANDILNNSGLSGIPDITSSISNAHRRGLLMGRITYNAAGQKLSEDAMQSTSYAALNTTNTRKAFAYHWANYAFSVTGSGYANAAQLGASSTYWTNIDDYRLLNFVHIDYDQNDPSRSIQTTNAFTYSTINRRLVSSISATNSLGVTSTKTYNYPDESGIPLITTPEQTAVTAMKNANFISQPVHEIDTRGAAITEIHNSFTAGSINGNNGYANTYLTGIAAYNTVSGVKTQVKLQSTNYELSLTNPLSTNALGGKSTAFGYGYNSSYVIAKADNATNTLAYSNQPVTQFGTIVTQGGSFTSQYSTFTTANSGTINIAMPPSGYLAGGVACDFAFTLSGPSNKSGFLCNSSTSSYSCSASNSVSYTAMPAGTYTLQVNPYTNTASSSQSVPVTFNYPGSQLVLSAYTEFFFEGFEENSSAASGSSHTGNMYWNGNYTVPYTPPNSRNYVIQYWSLSGGAWIFHESGYSTNMVLTGPVDDVRVFPSDGLITTYTFNPLVGKTSETDPAGRSTKYIYDGLNRVQTVLDQDNNILKQYEYKYQLLPATGGTGVGITGTSSFSTGGTTSASGNFYGPVGFLVTVTLAANGTSGFSYGLTLAVSGAPVTGTTSVTNGSSSFTFIMPASGTVSYVASFVPTGGTGTGSITVH